MQKMNCQKHRFGEHFVKKRNKRRPCTRQRPRTSQSIKAFLKFKKASAARKRRRADEQNGHIPTCILYHINDIKSREIC